jgi:hypothetical protein
MNRFQSGKAADGVQAALNARLFLLDRNSPAGGIRPIENSVSFDA